MGSDSVLGIKEKCKTHTRRVITAREIERIEYKVRHTWPLTKYEAPYYCPYGMPGDRLWIKETWRELIDVDRGHNFIVYKADGEILPPHDLELSDAKWKSPLFMPRWACRLVLEIVHINLERLHDITEEGVKLEGWGGYLNSYMGDDCIGNGPRTWFHKD